MSTHTQHAQTQLVVPNIYTSKKMPRQTLLGTEWTTTAWSLKPWLPLLKSILSIDAKKGWPPSSA